MATSRKSLYTVRIFPDDETTKIVYEDVTHVFWEAGNTVLTLCLPDDVHVHWLREKFRHYDVIEQSPDPRYGRVLPLEPYTYFRGTEALREDIERGKRNLVHPTPAGGLGI